MAAKPPTRQDMLDYCEQLTAYLFDMRFGQHDPAVPLSLPPALPGSTVFADARHTRLCKCPLCAEERYRAAGGV